MDRLFSNIRSERLYEKIVTQIRALIEEGKLKPGDKLPGERELSTTLGCSRTSLREAFRVLEAEGLIISKSGGGRFVQQIEQSIKYEYHKPTVDLLEKSAILYFLEAREILEPRIAELAVHRATAADLEKIEKALGEVEKSFVYSDQKISSDMNFHVAVAEATHNFVFVSIIESNLHMIRQIRKQTLTDLERYQQSLEEHKQILLAIQNRDVQLAMTATTMHLQNLRKNIEKSLRDNK